MSWSKYVDKSEVLIFSMLRLGFCCFLLGQLEQLHVFGLCALGLKTGENSIKAVNCLNEMIMNALIHTNDCLRYISTMQHPTIFQSCAMVQVDFLLFKTSDYHITHRQ